MAKSKDKDIIREDSMNAGDDDIGDAPAATKPKVNYGKEFLHCAGNNDAKRVVEIIEMGKRTGDDYINYQSKIGNSGLLQAAVCLIIIIEDLGYEIYKYMFHSYFYMLC